jgi:hypothetical protein
LPRRPKNTDETSEKNLSNEDLERPLHGHEILRQLHFGRIPPGEYCYKVEYMDGRVKMETFRVDKHGRVRNLKIWIENPDSTEAKSEKRKGRARRPQKARGTGKRVSNGD